MCSLLFMSNFFCIKYLLLQLEQKKKEKMNRKDHWLHPGIVVKVMTKKLGEKYYKKKAYVKVILF